MTLANDIANELNNAVGSASNELGITKQFIRNLGQLTTPSNVKIETGFCHQKPYAFFKNPSRYANKKKCELGDILWVFKTVHGRAVTDHRVIFSQVKYSTTAAFHIEQHQYQFLLGINTNSFEFGRSVYHNAGYQPMLFASVTKSSHFSNYLFIAPTSTPKCESTSQLNLSTSSASFNATALGDFGVYIGSFLQFQSFGMNILHNKQGWKLVDIVCKRLGITLDPEEEWKDYFEEDESGFGAVLITALEERD